jgi:ureidoglycolate hydrolase
MHLQRTKKIEIHPQGSTTFIPYILYTLKYNMVLLPTLPTFPYLLLPCYLENDPLSSSLQDK